MSSFLISFLDKAFVVQSKNLIESPSSRDNPSGATEFVAITKTMGLSRERWKASDHLGRLALSVPSKGSRTSPGGRAALVAGVAQTAQPAHDLRLPPPNQGPAEWQVVGTQGGCSAGSGTSSTHSSLDRAPARCGTLSGRRLDVTRVAHRTVRPTTRLSRMAAPMSEPQHVVA